MSLSSSLTLSGTVGQNAFGSKTITRAHDAAIPLSASIPAAKVGQLTTRTDNDTGVATMVTGHGFITSDLLDVYWTEAGVDGARRNMVATVAGDAVTIDGGTGDNLPTNLTALTVTKQTTLDADFVGNNLQMIMVACEKRSIVQLMAGATAELIQVQPANEPYFWAINAGVTNPIAGDTITSIKVSQSDSAAAHDVNIGIAYDPTP